MTERSLRRARPRRLSDRERGTRTDQTRLTQNDRKQQLPGSQRHADRRGRGLPGRTGVPGEIRPARRQQGARGAPGARSGPPSKRPRRRGPRRPRPSAQSQATLDEARAQAREIVTQANKSAERIAGQAEERGAWSTTASWHGPKPRSPAARQRAVDEVSAKVGALVMSVARQVIGREIDAPATGPHRRGRGRTARIGGHQPPPGPRAEAQGRRRTERAIDERGRVAHRAPVASGLHHCGPRAGRRRAARPEVAEDLNAVAHLVSRTNELAVALTDFAVPAAARKAVLEDLLSTRVHPVALGSCCAPWTPGGSRNSPPSSTSSTSSPATCTTSIPRSLRAEEPIVSRTAWRDFMAGYADAVFDDVPATGRARGDRGRAVPLRPCGRVEPGAAQRPVRHLGARRGPRRRSSTTCSGQGAPRHAAPGAPHAVQGRVRDLVASLDWLAEQAARARGWRVARVCTGASRSMPTSSRSPGRGPGAAHRASRWSCRSWPHPTFSAVR